MLFKAIEGSRPKDTKWKEGEMERKKEEDDEGVGQTEKKRVNETWEKYTAIRPGRDDRRALKQSAFSATFINFIIFRSCQLSFSFLYLTSTILHPTSNIPSV